MELTSHAPRCYAALDFPFTKFSKSAAFISPTVHFITVHVIYWTHHPMTDRQLLPAEQWHPALVMQRDGRLKNKTHCSLCLSPPHETFGENITLICLVFGCNYQPYTITKPLLLSSYIVSPLCFAFLIVFFVPLFCLLIPAD